jgi:outer membrane lipoprotein SlyB
LVGTTEGNGEGIADGNAVGLIEGAGMGRMDGNWVGTREGRGNGWVEGEGVVLQRPHVPSVRLSLYVYGFKIVKRDDNMQKLKVRNRSHHKKQKTIKETKEYFIPPPL